MVGHASVVLPNDTPLPLHATLNPKTLNRIFIIRVGVLMMRGVDESSARIRSLASGHMGKISRWDSRDYRV